MKKHNQFHLLGTRRFLPLFCTQFLGAFNDNILKNALVLLITYVLAERNGQNGQILVTEAAGIFILPFFLFSATAGQLADKFDKSLLIRIIKAAEIFIMLVAAYGFHIGHTSLLLAALFLMGIHSAFFGPLKYGVLPEHLRPDELISGNALVEAGTFLAILLGTILGGIIILTEHGTHIISLIMLGVALAGFLSSLFIPHTRPMVPNMTLSLNIFVQTWKVVGHSHQKRDVFMAILGISWFWLVGATFLSQFPTYVKGVLHANEHVVTLFLTVFSIGIGAGSMLCNRLLKGEVRATFVPLAALGMALCTIDLYFASRASAGQAEIMGLMEFLGHGPNLRIVADLLLLALSGGIYIVPLYAILQARSEKEYRARTIASNNILNALFMVASALITVALFSFHFTVTQVFLLMGLANGIAALLSCKLLPRGATRAFFGRFLRRS